MNFVRRNDSQVRIAQVPILLLLVGALFSFPLLAFSLFHIIRGTDAEGKYFTLFFGLLMLWLFLEFVATREWIKIDLARRILTRKVSGVFRNTKQVIDLHQVDEVRLEVRVDTTGRRRVKRQYVYLCGNGAKHLLNSPAKLYLDHAKLGRLLSEVTGLPFQET